MYKKPLQIDTNFFYEGPESLNIPDAILINNSQVISSNNVLEEYIHYNNNVQQQNQQNKKNNCKLESVDNLEILLSEILANNFIYCWNQLKAIFYQQRNCNKNIGNNLSKNQGLKVHENQHIQVYEDDTPYKYQIHKRTSEKVTAGGMTLSELDQKSNILMAHKRSSEAHQSRQPHSQRSQEGQRSQFETSNKIQSELPLQSHNKIHTSYRKTQQDGSFSKDMSGEKNSHAKEIQRMVENMRRYQSIRYIQKEKSIHSRSKSKSKSKLNLKSKSKEQCKSYHLKPKSNTNENTTYQKYTNYDRAKVLKEIADKLVHKSYSSQLENENINTNSMNEDQKARIQKKIDQLEALVVELLEEDQQNRKAEQIAKQSQEISRIKSKKNQNSNNTYADQLFFQMLIKDLQEIKGEIVEIKKQNNQMFGVQMKHKEEIARLFQLRKRQNQLLSQNLRRQELSRLHEEKKRSESLRRQLLHQKALKQDYYQKLSHEKNRNSAFYTRNTGRVQKNGFKESHEHSIIQPLTHELQKGRQNSIQSSYLNKMAYKIDDRKISTEDSFAKRFPLRMVSSKPYPDLYEKEISNFQTENFKNKKMLEMHIRNEAMHGQKLYVS